MLSAVSYVCALGARPPLYYDSSRFQICFCFVGDLFLNVECLRQTITRSLLNVCGVKIEKSECGVLFVLWSKFFSC